MGQVTIKKENSTYCITHTLSANESINKDVAQRLAQDLSDVFFPIIISEADNSLQCNVKSGYVSLKEFQERVIDKQTFFEIVIQMDMMIRIGEQKGLFINNMDLDYRRVFIEVDTGKVFFIYWPINNPQTRNSLEYFFREMAYTSIFNRYEENTYVSRYIKFFKKGEMFSLVNFEEMIMLLANEGEEREDNVPRQKQIMPNIPDQNLTHNSQYSNSSQGETTALDPMFWLQTNTQAVGNLSNDETGVLDPSLMNFGNPVYNPHSSGRINKLSYLIRTSKGEKITIGKSEFILGSGKSTADYVIGNNKTISRKHASIITRGSRYFIIDHKSTNSTYINDNIIEAEVEYELFSGDRIKLSDEEFTFYI